MTPLQKLNLHEGDIRVVTYSPPGYVDKTLRVVTYSSSPGYVGKTLPIGCLLRIAVDEGDYIPAIEIVSKLRLDNVLDITYATHPSGYITSALWTTTVNKLSNIHKKTIKVSAPWLYIRSDYLVNFTSPVLHAMHLVDWGEYEEALIRNNKERVYVE